jgi:hypothetical protein
MFFHIHASLILKLDQRIAVIILFVFFSFVNWPESTDNANLATKSKNWLARSNLKYLECCRLLH